MVDNSKPAVPDPVDPAKTIGSDFERKRRELEQLEASKSDMAGAIGNDIDWLLEMEAAGMLRRQEDMEREPFGIAEVSQRARQPLVREPGMDHRTGKLDPRQVSWHDFGNHMEHEPERGRDLWFELNAAAQHELATGVRNADALEGPMSMQRRPWQRARYLAIVDALTEDLRPRGVLEGLMLQRMRRPTSSV